MEKGKKLDLFLVPLFKDALVDKFPDTTFWSGTFGFDFSLWKKFGKVLLLLFTMEYDLSSAKGRYQLQKLFVALLDSFESIARSSIFGKSADRDDCLTSVQAVFVALEVMIWKDETFTDDQNFLYQSGRKRPFLPNLK